MISPLTIEDGFKQTRKLVGGLPDTLVSGMSRGNHQTKPGGGIEHSVSNFINSVDKKSKEESQ